jgi:hypothetical protein
MAVVPHGTTAGRGNSVGTGSWSVERRYPHPSDKSGGRAGPPGKGRLLSRAGQAVERASPGGWEGIAALCVLAVIVVALLTRRARRAA